MFIVSIISGLLSTMNVWADKISDINIGLNDIYMSTLMAGWMILFMGHICIGSIIVMIWFALIRTQLFINQSQFLRGMIPHHSMAVHMSKKLEKNPNTISKLLNDIITSQEQEIKYMKHVLTQANSSLIQPNSSLIQPNSSLI